MIDYNSEEYTKNRLSRLMERLMQSTMNSINSYSEAMDELTYIHDSCDGQLQTDVAAVIEDIRTKLSGDETGHLNLLSKWQAHFGEIIADEIKADIPDSKKAGEGADNVQSD